MSPLTKFTAHPQPCSLRRSSSFDLHGRSTSASLKPTAAAETAPSRCNGTPSSDHSLLPASLHRDGGFRRQGNGLPARLATKWKRGGRKESEREGGVEDANRDPLRDERRTPRASYCGGPRPARRPPSRRDPLPRGPHPARTVPAAPGPSRGSSTTSPPRRARTGWSPLPTRPRRAATRDPSRTGRARAPTPPARSRPSAAGSSRAIEASKAIKTPPLVCASLKKKQQQL